MKKKLASVLVLTLLFAACFGAVFDEGMAAHAADEGKTIKHHLDVGVTHIWGRGSSVEAATWDNGYKKGTDISVSVTLYFPKAIETVKAYEYSADKFDWENANKSDGVYTFNTNSQSLLKDEQSFKNYYWGYTSSKITNISASANKKNISLQYTMRLESKNKSGGIWDDFDLKDYLNRGDKDFAFSFLGGETIVRAAYPEVAARFDEAETGKIASDLYGYLYFVPLIIEYTEANSCTLCGDPLPDGETQCSEDSCPEWDTEECGCYEPPERPQVVPPPDTTGSCTDSISWSEIASHSYSCGGANCSGHTCNHVYTYRSNLSTTATLTSLKPNGNSTTFKSGYGFTVSLNNSLSTSQISNSGACGSSKTKANSKIPQAPLSAEVRNNWTVALKNVSATQPKIINLTRSSNGVSTTTFVTPANALSAQNAAAIYTDVALAGTKEKPVAHTIQAYTHGGGVNGVQFCKSVALTFTINGNMYEDDWTVDGGTKNTK